MGKAVMVVSHSGAQDFAPVLAADMGPSCGVVGPGPVAALPEAVLLGKAHSAVEELSGGAHSADEFWYDDPPVPLRRDLREAPLL